MEKKRIFQYPEFEIIRDDFTRGRYSEALPRFRELYDTLGHELSAADKAILLSRIANCASDAILTQGMDHGPLIGIFWEYLEKYLDIAPQALEEDQRLRGSDDEPKKRLREALELLIRHDREQLRDKAGLWVRRFAGVEIWGFKLALDVLMEKINEERIHFAREGHAENTRAMAHVYIEVSEQLDQEYRYSRATVMNILSDLVYFEGGKDSDKVALSWLERCLEINPDDLFAKKRKEFIEERQMVEEQIRRFRHDTAGALAGIKGTLEQCLSLPSSEEPLSRYLRTIRTEVEHLYGVHRFIHEEQPDYQWIDAEAILTEIILPHDNQHARFFLTVSGSGQKWEQIPRISGLQSITWSKMLWKPLNAKESP
ncbi:MAG: hypothetical protein DRI57_07955 [Deltaproteobacteria bacterium]|nr:MAG: hypothetical protein DRI57_07955 [Deltaproteobacteria bacterium]